VLPHYGAFLFISSRAYVVLTALVDLVWQTQLEYGLPEQFETPRVCQVKQRSIMIGWFAGNPVTFGAASQTFHVQVSGGGKVRNIQFVTQGRLIVPQDLLSRS
jgi:hypothetical protein